MIGVTREIDGPLAVRRCAGLSVASSMSLPIVLATLVDLGGHGCGGSRRPRRIPSPRRQTEIIGELATWPILPILQTMFGGQFTAPLHRRNSVQDHVGTVNILCPINLI